MNDFQKVEQMADALNTKGVALSRDGECRLAYLTSGIDGYTEAEHEAAWEEAMLGRLMLIAQQGVHSS
jgi:hypothetical protein